MRTMGAGAMWCRFLHTPLLLSRKGKMERNAAQARSVEARPHKVGDDAFNLA